MGQDPAQDQGRKSAPTGSNAMRYSFAEEDVLPSLSSNSIHDPTAVATLSEDPLLDAAKENIDVSTHYSVPSSNMPRTM